MTNEPSETPRTIAAFNAITQTRRSTLVKMNEMFDFARQLERETAELRRRLEDMRKAAEAARVALAKTTPANPETPAPHPG